MNEEQAVLDFFAKPENLPLGLSVAELINDIRIRMNTNFWQDLLQRLNTQTDWQMDAIEDRNTSDVLVGLRGKFNEQQTICLFPVLEQQYMGGTWRIFSGLMWQSAPTAEQLALPDVSALKSALSDAGYNNNENFLAWQWTPFYPQRRDFLLRYSRQPEILLDEVESAFNLLLSTHREQIASVNAALKDAPRSMAISLDQLRKKRSE